MFKKRITNCPNNFLYILIKMINEIIKMYVDDKISILNIATHFGLGYKKTRNILLKNNIKLRHRNTKNIRKHSVETRKKMSLSAMGDKNHNFGKKCPIARETLQQNRAKIFNDPVMKSNLYKKISETRKLKGLSKGKNNPMSKPDVIKKWIKSNNNRLSPNKKEIKLFEMIREIKTGYQINTHGEIVIIGNKIPDIVNLDDRKIIEMYGDFWHKDETIEQQQERINAFKQEDFDTLIIWERELKNETELINKLRIFVQ